MKRFTLGVLLVHGIGTQRPGDTLVQWGDTLLKTIRPATQDTVTATVQKAAAGDRDEGCAEVTLVYKQQCERWLLAEACWADAFPAPSYRELVSWSVRALPWALALHIATWHWQRTTTGWRRWPESMLAVAQLVVFLALSPLLVVFLGLTLLLGLLPIPQLRSIILSAQSGLTATIGDSMAFVESPMRAALIRERIRTRLRRLKARCTHTIVVAHSQGAAAVFDTLGGLVDERTGRSRNWDDELEQQAPDALVTFGAGTNQLASQLQMSGGMPKDVPANPITAATLALTFVWAAMAYVWYELRAGRITLMRLGWALAYEAVWVAVLSGGTYAITLFSQRRGHRASNGEFQFTTAESVALGAWLLVAFVGGRLFADSLGLPIGTVMAISGALAVLAGAIYLMLSPGMHTFLSKAVRVPPGVRHWLDVYAAADPVPHGRTRVAQESIDTTVAAGSTIESAMITNEGSLLADHTIYWQNLDGFVLRVLRACGTTAGSPWLARLPPNDPAVDRRAAWRAGILRAANWLVYVAWFIAGAALAGRRAEIPFPFDLPRWLPLAFVQLGLYIALVCGGAWLSMRGIHAAWRWWTQSDQLANLRRTPFVVTPFWGVLMIAQPVWTVIFVAWFAAARAEVLAGEALQDILLFLALPFGVAFVSALIYMAVNPPPSSRTAVVAKKPDSQVERV